MRTTVRLAVTDRSCRARRPGTAMAEFDVDRDCWRHLLDLYRFHRRWRQLSSADGRALIWFSLMACKR